MALGRQLTLRYAAALFISLSCSGSSNQGQAARYMHQALVLYMASIPGLSLHHQLCSYLLRLLYAGMVVQMTRVFSSAQPEKALYLTPYRHTALPLSPDLQ